MPEIEVNMQIFQIISDDWMAKKPKLFLTWGPKSKMNYGFWWNIYEIIKTLKVRLLQISLIPPKMYEMILLPTKKSFNDSKHGLRIPREEIAFTARPKIQSQSQIFRYGRSIFGLPHQPNFSDIFDLCLHWVSVVRVLLLGNNFGVAWWHTQNFNLI